ncbi:myosin head protein (macronuclear) [Tetrahymena thermophila SB210]|uniref:Myosin head protein n=2 Tax=Tetrahymena thermophila TaxID=5911 RepID=I7M6B1_TETTS|nr:myosin head protein [Tetrahymena thermophila SB210]EAR84886.2 myosin head protein [Tetrahymena thermophila SB210]BAE16258.1 myosin 8 [Tetrahymena thermophila]|eukprot:XP_001032549.2 myosin head protein [Tetrahymena thermophila SB210]
MNENQWMISQAPCWFKLSDKKEEKKLFYKGRIKESTANSDQVLVCYEKDESNQGEVMISKQNIFQRDENQQNQLFEDMVNMATLNESELIINIQNRYSQDLIFTYIGPTLIVMNPYKKLDEQFSPKVIQSIKDNLNQQKQLFSLSQQSPHIYAIAALSFKNLFQNNKKQAIVISGESGAGKTENAKYAMKFLTQLSNNQEQSSNIQKSVISIEDRILSCNPLLEAFGNAKTVRNDNSSRFGKYVKILVNKQQRIIGAFITKYLLEKSRVIHLSEGERNYHIFYHLLIGGDKNIIQQVSLSGKKVEDFVYLNQSSCRNLENMNDQEMFQGILDSLRKMNFSDNLELSIFKLLSAILYLGNIEFDDKEYDVNTPCKVQNEDMLQIVATLLSTDSNQLKESFIKKARQTPGSIIYSPVTKNECINNKNTLSKALYDKLFSWLVGKLNDGIIPEGQDLQNLKNSDILNIGLLDIFGFENFELNSFEQMCINYTNEYLQQLYIAYVFKNEEKIFIEDGLSKYLSNLSYQDNQAILDLFDTNSGIFALLNESCLLKNSTDTTFLTKIKEQNQNNKKLIFPKLIKCTFTICHTQSNVEYNVEGFREKNMDELNQEIQNCILNSKNQDILEIFSFEEQSSQDKSMNSQQGKFVSNNAKNKYLCSKFKQQMTELMGELNSSDVHFVRCIKPNEEKKKDHLIQGYVMQQIRYLGVLESIEVRKHTYPVRKTYQAFFIQYRVCSDVLEFSKRTDYQKLCQEILIECFKSVSDKQVLYGQSRIYLKQEFEIQLEKLKQNCIKKKQTAATISIQKIFRRLQLEKKQRKSIQIIRSIFKQVLLNHLYKGFEKIKSKAKEQTFIKFYKKIDYFFKVNKAISFYAIKEFYLKVKAVEEIERKKSIYRQQEDIKLKQQSQQNLTNSTDQSSKRLSQTQNNSNNLQSNSMNHNIILSDQYDKNFSTNMSNSAYFTSQVEPNGAVIDSNKFYYQDNQQNLYVTNQNVDINNYNTKNIQDWNQFAFQDPDQFGDNTIFIPRPTEEENQNAEKLAKLLSSNSPETIEEIDEKADDCYFKLEDIEVDQYHEIKKFDMIAFYKQHLNIRKNYFGVKKDEKEILSYQKKCLSKGTLIQVNDEEKKAAISHFQFLLELMKLEKYDDSKLVSIHIQDLNLVSLKKSTQFYNEVTTQIIKQLNKNKKESESYLILQYLKVFLYCFTPDDDFLKALMHFLIFYLYENQWKDNMKIKNYILYIIPSIIRKIDQENPRKQLFTLLIPQYEINALILQNKLCLPIAFCTGISIQVCADSWDTVEQLKQKIMKQVQINTDRIKPNYLQLFELQFIEENKTIEKMLLPDQYIWDILYLQNQKQIQKVQSMKEKGNYNQQMQQKESEQYIISIFMIKVLFPFTLYPDDIAGISLQFSQVFFDIYVGKQIIDEVEKIIQLSALLKIINNCHSDQETMNSLPLIMQQESRQEVIGPINKEYERIKGLFNVLQAKYMYLMIAKDNKYYLGLQIEVKYIPPEIEIQDYQCKLKTESENEFNCSYVEVILVLKPTYFFIVTSESKKIIIEYSYQDIERWGRSKYDLQDHILIQTKGGIKHLIQSKYSAQILFYFQESKNLMQQAYNNIIDDENEENRLANNQLIQQFLEYYQNNNEQENQQ